MMVSRTRVVWATGGLVLVSACTSGGGGADVAGIGLRRLETAAELPASLVPYGAEPWRQPAESGQDHGALALPARINVGDIVDRVRHAFAPPAAGGDMTVRAGTYRASATPHGLVFSPHRPADAADADALPVVDAAVGLRLRTASIEAGGRRLDAAGRERVVFGNTVQTLLAGGIVEHFEAKGAGVELVWYVPARPGAGDLTVTLGISGFAYAGKTPSGHHYKDASGVARVRIGRAVLVDAAGRVTDVPATATQGGLVFTVAAATLDAAEFPIVVDPWVTSEFGLDEPVEMPGTRLSPSVSVASSPYEHAVVWADTRNGGSDIYSTFVGLDGSVRQPFGLPVSTAAGAQLQPRVVVTPAGTYLAVWADQRSGATTNIYTRILPGNDLASSGNAVSAAGSNQSEPSVACSSQDCAVVWADTRGGAGNRDIYGSIVSFFGWVQRADFPVATSSSDEWAPAVASNGSRYLVTWNRSVSGSRALYGVRVETTGAASLPEQQLAAGVGSSRAGLSRLSGGSDYLVAWETAAGDVMARTVGDAGGLGAVAVVSAGAAYEGAPAVASAGSEYLVTWQDHRSGDGDIYAQRMSALGARVDLPLTVSLATAQQSFPEVSSAAPGSYLIVWHDQRKSINGEIYGARVDSQTLDAAGIPIVTLRNEQRTPRAAFNGTIWLVVWEDTRNADWDIYGVGVSAAGTILQPNGLAISTAPAEQTGPAVAALGSTFLVVWHDERVSIERDVYAARVSAEFVVLEPQGFPVCTAAGGRAYADVAASGGNWLVVWTDFRVGWDIYGAQVSPAGAVLQPTGFPIGTSAPYEARPKAGGSPGGGYFVVWWEMHLGGDPDLRGSRVSAEGVVLDTPGVALAGGLGVQVPGGVAASGPNEYFVVWSDRRGTSYDVRGRTISTVSIPVLGPDVLLAGSGADEIWPEVTWNRWAYLVAWTQARASWDVVGRYVSTSGGLLGVSFDIAADAGNELDPALAPDGTGRVLAAYRSIDTTATGTTERVKGVFVLADGDGDGYSGLVDDCDDTDPTSHPGAAEMCDGNDNDCLSGVPLDEVDNDGDGYVECVPWSDTQGDQPLVLAGGDCDDAAAGRYPGATEIVGDGVDQDCNGFDTVTCFLDADLDGFGSTSTLSAADGDCNDPGESPVSTDCNDANSAAHPGAPEIVGDGADQDCNGFDTVTCFVDADLDGYGSAATLLAADGDCADPGESSVATDCNDANSSIHPGAAEACDLFDWNCNGSLVDEYADYDSDGQPDCVDPDDDNDGVGDSSDLCATGELGWTSNALTDHDGDGCRDSGEDLDYDNDGVADVGDNCQLVANPTQTDSDGDGHGDACDVCPGDRYNDIDGDGLCADSDNCWLVLNAGQEDADADGHGDVCDNCPTAANPTQADSDHDGIGNACDACAGGPDIDGDGVCEINDNCWFTANAGQEDTDADGVGDACDACPLVPDPHQWDRDFDGLGDECDDDDDDDGIPDASDNCRITANQDQQDGDADGVGNACDNCATVANASQTDGDADGRGDACDDDDADGALDLADNCLGRANASQADADADGRGDMCDNCPSTPNADQSDADADGLGNACDADDDNDGVPDDSDNCPLVSNVAQDDSDGDGMGDVCDNCPTLSNSQQTDSDSDGVGDACDNCPMAGNSAQEDTDADGNGDACDADRDGDGTPDYLGYLLAMMPLKAQSNRDSDGDGVSDYSEAIGDSNGDGLPDGGDFSQTPDTNGDGEITLSEILTAGHLAVDSDGDGVPDLYERRDRDSDWDGVMDQFDPQPASIPMTTVWFVDLTMETTYHMEQVVAACALGPQTCVDAYLLSSSGSATLKSRFLLVHMTAALSNLSFLLDDPNSPGFSVLMDDGNPTEWVAAHIPTEMEPFGQAQVRPSTCSMSPLPQDSVLDFGVCSAEQGTRFLVATSAACGGTSISHPGFVPLLGGIETWMQGQRDSDKTRFLLHFGAAAPGNDYSVDHDLNVTWQCLTDCCPYLIWRSGTWTNPLRASGAAFVSNVNEPVASDGPWFDWRYAISLPAEKLEGVAPFAAQWEFVNPNGVLSATPHAEGSMAGWVATHHLAYTLSGSFIPLVVTKPSGDPVAAPVDGKNEFTFTPASPGVLTIGMQASRLRVSDGSPIIDDVADRWLSERLRWRVTEIDDSHSGGAFVGLSFSPGAIAPNGEPLGASSAATATFTRLPRSNNDFGKHLVILGLADDSGNVAPLGGSRTSAVYEVFYTRDATNHPLGQIDSPNWYHYWLQALGGRPDTEYGGPGPGSAYGQTPGIYQWSFVKAPEKTKVIIYDPAAEFAIPDPCSTYAGGARTTGIDVFETTLGHEDYHTQQIFWADAVVGLAPDTAWRFGWSWNQDVYNNHWAVGPDGLPGVANVDDDGNGFIDDYYVFGPGELRFGDDIQLHDPGDLEWPLAFGPMPSNVPPECWAQDSPIEDRAWDSAPMSQNARTDLDWGNPGKQHDTRLYDD